MSGHNVEIDGEKRIGARKPPLRVGGSERHTQNGDNRKWNAEELASKTIRIFTEIIRKVCKPIYQI